ncbi:MAG: hypothetical protein HS132_11735 [Planctomycetia bacterium]|nr:hypothetical protein [Planctomycetia bacterium]
MIPTEAFSGRCCEENQRKLREGKTEVFDADLSSYFDTIPHKELLLLIGMRINDKNVLYLIKMWLKSTGGRGKQTRWREEK